jgi:hypothetical protein
MEGIEPTLLVTLILLVPAIQAQDSSVSAGAHVACQSSRAHCAKAIEKVRCIQCV